MWQIFIDTGNLAGCMISKKEYIKKSTPQIGCGLPRYF
jgi:hypothetical protein